MSKSQTLTSGSAIVIAALAGTVAWLAVRRPAKASPPKPSAPPSPPSPFVPGSHCTLLADGLAIQRWVQEVVEPVMRPQLNAYAVPPSDHEAARMAIEQLVDQVLGHVLPECIGVDTTATRMLWKGLWCEVVAERARLRKIDEELDDVLRRCLDPTFDPRALGSVDGSKEHPRPPRPRPPVPEPEPRDEERADAPPNLSTATTREALSRIGLMRMVEGTVAGAPIKGPQANTVLLAHNPAWPGLESARAELRRLAAEHPRLAFVEASFVDTQRHFGKPRDLYGLMWVLAATAPDGRVFPRPLVRDDPRDEPPSPEQWAKVIAYASGFVGARPVRRVPSPRRLGDYLVAMAPARSSRRATSTTSPTTKARRRRARAPG